MFRTMFLISLIFLSLTYTGIGAETQTTPSIVLINGNKIPQIGLGTYNLTDDQDVMDRILNQTIDIGYRHIDTAYVYQNEELIGRSLKKLFEDNRIRRENIFITSKVWNTYHKRSQVVEAMKLSLNLLRLDYLDLALVHWPMAYRGGNGFLRPQNNKTHDLDIDIVETWKGMEDAYRLGLAKSIGVSNFNSEQLNRILRQTFIKPVVNQIEVNPYLSQEKLVEFCQNNSIQVTAYCPLGRVDKDLLNDSSLNLIGDRHNKTVPQVILRWLIQRDIVVIPKTSKAERLLENFNVFDFQLTEDEMKTIFTLNKNKRIIAAVEASDNREYPFHIPYR